jgi:hypothetical protein
VLGGCEPLKTTMAENYHSGVFRALKSSVMVCFGNTDTVASAITWPEPLPQP